MNIIILVLLVFACIGMIDKMLGNRLGLAKAFDTGLTTMGNLCFSMVGIYCGAITLVEKSDGFLSYISKLPIDASLFIGSILAPDLGGYPLAVGVSQISSIGQFSGILVSSMLGCLISFVLPLSLGMLPKKEHRSYLEGVVWGIVSLPFGLIPGGILLGMNGIELITGMLPILIICAILILLLRYMPQKTLQGMTILGKVVTSIGTILFGVVVWSVFLPNNAIFSLSLVGEALIVVIKITFVICGSLVINAILMRYGKGFFQIAASKLKVNEQSIMGLLISFATSISMLGMYANMDELGKKMNAAFSVGGAFCLGGQLAYIAAISTSRGVLAYLVCKMVCGISSVLLVKRFG